MKKNFKNLLLMVLMGLSIVFIGACGEKPLPKEEVVTKVIEADKGIKSLKINFEAAIPVMSVTVKTTAETLVIREPFAIEMERQAAGLLFNSYVKDGIDYGYNPLTKKWGKKEVNTEKINELYSSYLLFDDEFYNLLKDNMDKVNVEKKDGNYIITLAENEFLKDMIAKKYQSFIQKGSEVTNFTFEYTVDGKTFLPVALNLDIDTLLGGVEKHSVKITSSYSKINEVKDIELSDEVKNAEEVKE